VDLKGSLRDRNQITVHLFVWRQRTQVKVVALHTKQEQMGGRSIAFGDRRGWVVSATPQALYPRERTTLPILEVVCPVAFLDRCRKCRLQLGSNPPLSIP